MKLLLSQYCFACRAGGIRQTDPNLTFLSFPVYIKSYFIGYTCKEILLYYFDSYRNVAE